MSQFNKDYYENGQEKGISCYTNYRWLPDLTLPLARAIVDRLDIQPDQRVLDFGCAKGYLVKALRLMGYRAYGVDISEYAISVADELVRPNLFLIAPGSPTPECDWAIAKDVLEHTSEDDLPQVLSSIRTTRLFVVVPLGDGKRYVIPEMEEDVTHKIREPLEWWVSTLRGAGYRWISNSYSMHGVKEKWTNKYPQGHGFLVASR